VKTCKRCGETKPLDQFHKHKETADGYRTCCRKCRSAELNAWRAKAPEATRKKTRAYYSTEEWKEYFRQWHLANKATLNARSRQWRIDNPDRHAAKEARRRAAKLKQTPKWADHEKIAAIYAEAAALRALGLDVEVDHYYPLCGKLVSGLHVPENLQLLLSEDNKRKGAKLPVSV
jgi:hypothetical protein